MQKNSIVILLLLFCAQNIFSQEISFKEIDFKPKKGKTVKAELGEFFVEENRVNSTGEKLKIAFVRFKSTSSNPQSPIVYLAGGPGGSGIKTAKGKRFTMFMKLREIADVIILDQRGTGKSNQLPKCKSYARFKQDKPITKSEYLEKTSKNINKCLQFYKENGYDLTAYNTTQSAFDIEDLRKALNAPKISLLGTSYGSHLAFEYIRNFENNIDKVVLSALEGPDETIKEPCNTDKFVKKLSKAAKSKYPNLLKTIKTVHNLLKKQPVIVEFKNRKGKLQKVGISEYELQGIITNFYLKNPKDSKKLPALYTKMYNGDFSEIAPIAVMMKRYAGAFRPMAFAMDMSSGISVERNKKIAKQIDKSIYGTSLSFLYYDWMNTLNFKQLPNDFRTQKTNNVKALLISGDLDGRTYVKPAKRIAKKFKNGKHIIVKNAGHDLFMASPKITDLIVDFFRDEDIKEDRIVLNPIIFD